MQTVFWFVQRSQATLPKQRKTSVDIVRTKAPAQIAETRSKVTLSKENPNRDCQKREALGRTAAEKFPAQAVEMELSQRKTVGKKGADEEQRIKDPAEDH